MVTMQTADNALKSFYLGAVSDQLNKSVNPLLAQIKQTTADIWGKDVRRVVRYGVNGGIGAGTEDGNLPTAGGNHYAQFVTTLKNLFGTIEISDKAIRSSTSNEGAFVNLLNDEMEGLIQSSSFNVGRMLFGDGKGTLATVASIASGVFTVDTVKNIAEGMIVDFVDADGNVLVGGRTVTKVDRKGKKVSVNGTTLTSTNVPNNSRIVIQNSNGLEITGLGAIFSDSATLYGVNRADHDWMNPYKQTSVGTISETKIQTAIDYLEEVSGSKVNFIVCSWGVKRALAEQLSTYKRVVDTVELEGGYKAMSFNGIPVVADRFCPDGTMYLLNTNDFCLHQLCDWQWLEGEDGKVLKQIAGKPVYTATLVKYAELVCTRPCGQAMLSGITEA
ncbi:MAG: phage major capsid protein [Clostridia bacterium]|nr:phage major capsid protein [Clostridia bacterium]